MSQVEKMSWQKAVILGSNEQVLHSWDGNCERQHKAVISKKGLVGTSYKTVKSKEIHSGTLALTNQRLLWFERRGFLSKTQRASFEIDLRNLHGISIGGAIAKWVSITDQESEYIFHLKGVGKKEAESFKDMILRQVEKLKDFTLTQVASVQKEVVTKEIVMIPCEYCRSLMPQTSLFCPNCGARRK